MMPPSQGGLATGRLCPCGKGTQVQCTWCHRSLCGEHYAFGPFEEGGNVALRPVCLPRCNASWWRQELDRHTQHTQSDARRE